MNSQTELSNHSIESWRWNVNPAWTSFTAMIQEGEMFHGAETQFEKNKLSKSCLYFGVTALESFINQEIRDSMREEGKTNDEILKIVYGGKLRKKWLEASKIGNIFHDDMYKRFLYYKEIRNEVTHPTRKDQLIHDYINVINTNDFVSAVKYIFVKICELQGKEYQYWMLGWNYIGFNFNKMELFLGNNMNGFYHSLQKMRVLGIHTGLLHQNDFSKRNMIGYESFLHFKEKLDEYPFDIEPENPMFDPPRLTRRWWDKKIIQSDSGETFQDDSNNPGWKLGWAVLSKTTLECAGFFDSQIKAKYVNQQLGNGYEVRFARRKENEVKLV